MARERTKSVGAVVLNGQKKILLIFRAQHRFWEFPKGKQGENETEEQTVARELREEAGIEHFEYIKPFREEIFYTFKLEGRVIERPIMYFLVKTDDTVTLSKEHTEMKWCTLADARHKVRFDNYQKILDQVEKYL